MLWFAVAIAAALFTPTSVIAIPIRASWETGDPWVRDLVRPLPVFDPADTLGAGDAGAGGVAGLPASDPEIGIHFSEIEGGREAAWRNHEGDRVHQGVHATIEGGAVVRIGAGDRASIRLRPRILLSGGGARLSWLEALATLRFGAGALDVGRTRRWLGPALHGSLLLSTNAHPLDLVHLRAAGPVPRELPFFPDLRSLSGGVALAFLSDDERDFPNPLLGILHVGSRWGSWLAIDLHRTILFAGEGRHFEWSLENLGDLLFADGENSNNPSENLSDQLGAASIVVRLDALFDDPARDARGARDGLWAYYEYAGEDNLKGRLLRNPGVTAGIRWSSGGWEIVGELANNRASAAPWYSHTVYTSGYTYRGVILGHHMGGGAREVVVSAAAPLPGARRVRLFAGREEALFGRGTPSRLWTIAGVGEDLLRRGDAALALDVLVRWGRRYPIEELGPIERARVSLRLSWRPDNGRHDRPLADPGSAPP